MNQLRPMRIFLFLFLLPFSAVCQKPTRIHKQKINRFFKQVDRIELVEIQQICDTILVPHRLLHPDTIMDTMVFAKFESLILKDSIDFTRIQTQVSLNGDEIDSLKAIFLNRSGTHFGGRSMCYSPRNGIFFYDKDDKLLAYYEWCFECNNTRLYNIPWNDYVSLDQKIRIMDFLRSHGIRTYYDCD